MMASSPKNSFNTCEKHQGHLNFGTLPKLTISCLPVSHRSQRNLAIIRMLAKLVVRLESPAGRMSGIIIDLDNSHNDSIIFRVRTAAHGGYDEARKEPTTVILSKLSTFRVDETRKEPTTVILSKPSTVRCLKSINVQLEEQKRTDTQSDCVDDIRILRATFPRRAFTDNDILTNICNALNLKLDTLFSFCLRTYQTIPFSLPSFLNDEIGCIKNIKFASKKTDVLEIELYIDETYVFDVSLFILAFASHPHSMRKLLGKTACEEVPNTHTDCSPLIVVSTEIFAKQSAIFGEISLCKLLSAQNIDKINEHISGLFPFEISVWLTERNLMTMIVGSAALLRVTQEQNTEQTDVGLDAENENQYKLAVLISYIHGMPYPHFSFGYVDRIKEDAGEVFSTTPSCPGSSGGLYIIIPGQPSTKLEDITFAAHKSSTQLKKRGSASDSSDIGNESVGQLFKFDYQQTVKH